VKKGVYLYLHIDDISAPSKKTKNICINSTGPSSSPLLTTVLIPPAPIEGPCQLLRHKGKGDDTSIAGIIDMEAVNALAPLLREQAAADDLKAEAGKAAAKTGAEQPAFAKPSAEKPVTGSDGKSGVVEDALNAINNAHAREAHGKASSGSADFADYGEFKTAAILQKQALS
jgi:hypothetical protein